ncbi:hypothetical protein B296_00045754 [Ensete ventricosum]|uniref:Uncharacterized protein n=1 Tax=Ensete ventricosum TaxID=4639 RepID=A0A426Z309_ENSVE|nr:hypothetical protein B296_00045754 [Ensete ventricosum]
MHESQSPGMHSFLLIKYTHAEERLRGPPLYCERKRSERESEPKQSGEGKDVVEISDRARAGGEPRRSPLRVARRQGRRCRSPSPPIPSRIRNPSFPIPSFYRFILLISLFWLPITGRIWEEKKRMGLDLSYGTAFNLRRDLDAQILSRYGFIKKLFANSKVLEIPRRFQRPPGALPSSMLGFEALTGGLDDFAFEDYLNLPQDSETFRPLDMHHGMEVRLGISKGPVCPSFL